MKFCDGIFKNVGDYEIKDEKVYKCTHICDLIHSNEAKVLAEYTSDFYKGRPALTRNSFGEGNAYYIASRNEDKFNFDFFSELIKEIGVERNIETELEDGVTVTKRESNGVKYLFVQNYSSEDKKVVLDVNEYIGVLTNENVNKEFILSGYGVKKKKNRI